MDKEKFDLDTDTFDYLILGTDLPESIIGAALASRGFSCMSIDSDFMYSGTLKSMNLRELTRFIENNDKSFKDHLVSNIRFESFTEDFKSLADVVDKLGFRSFNFDLEPKFLYSDSYSTKELIAIGVDNYINFRPVRDISFYYKGELQKLPLSKGLVMKAKQFSLKEKKCLIDEIEALQKFVQKYIGEADVNSIKDFEKEIYSMEFNDKFARLSENLDAHHSEVFKILFGDRSSPVIEDLIRYVICNAKKASAEDPTTCRELLQSFHIFIKSSGVHDLYPYLYPVYGIGDLSQVFSRIGALNNAIFLINPLFEITSITKPQDSEYFKFELKQDVHSYTLHSKSLICGRQYSRKVRQLLKLPDVKKVEVCKKLLVVCENTKKNNELEYPMYACFPVNSEGLGNPTAISVALFGPNTQATKDNFFYLHISFLEPKEDSKFDATLATQAIVNSINTSKEILLEPRFTLSFDRVYEETDAFEMEEPGIVFAPSFGKDTTIDNIFAACRNALLLLQILKSPHETLIVKKAPEAQQVPTKDHDTKLIEELESFKFE